MQCRRRRPGAPERAGPAAPGPMLTPAPGPLVDGLPASPRSRLRTAARPGSPSLVPPGEAAGDRSE